MSSEWWGEGQGEGEDGSGADPQPDPVEPGSGHPVEPERAPSASAADGWWGEAQSEGDSVDPNDLEGAQPLGPEHLVSPATGATPATHAYPTLGPSTARQAPTVQTDAVQPTLGPPTEAQPTLGHPGGDPAAASGAPPTEGPAEPTLGRRMAVVGRFVASLLVLVGAAALLAWSIKSSLESDPTAVRLAAEVAESPSPAGVSPRTSLLPQNDIVDLPDVRGSDRNEALAVLTEAGLAADTVNVKEVAWVPPVGVVVDQSPAPGTDDPESVELSISKKATAPKLAGMSEDDAVEALEALGAAAEITREYRAGTEPGKVVAQDPADGTELTESVGITIAEAGVPVSLAEIDTTGSSYGCGSGTVTVNSVDREAEISCTVYPGDEAETSEYVLAGQHGGFRSTLVVSSDSQLGQQARVTVSTETGEIANETVGVGSEVPIAGDVTGAQRLIISIAPLSADDSASSDGVQVGLVEAELLTSPDVAEQLAGD